MRKKTSGSSGIARREVFSFAAGLVSLPVVSPALFAFQSKDGPYAVVAGTVFQESGFSFPDVSVTLMPKKGGKKQTASTSFRGEFSFRVPPDAAKYVVTATKKGFVTKSIDAEVPGTGRIDVTLTLVAESKK